MSLRLRSDIWIAGYLRRAVVGGAYAVVRRKGVPEAGAIFIVIDRLNGEGTLFGPAPQSLSDDEHGGRLFRILHEAETTSIKMIDDRLAKETKFDPDCWILEVEDKQGRSFLDGSII